MSNNINEKFIKFLMTLVVLIDFMGVAIVVVLFPNIFIDPNSLLFSSDWGSSERLIALGACLALYPLGQFFGSSILGKLSDMYGRKKILAWTLLGTAAGFLFSAFSLFLSSYSLLFFSRLFTGLCAGNVAVAQASLVDISNESTKARNISLAQMAMGSAYVIGPVVGALLADSSLISWFNPSVPFLFLAFVLIIELAVVVLFFKETSSKNINHKINLLDGFEQISTGLRHPKTASILGVWFVFVAGWWLFESFMPAFLLEKFNFNTSEIGFLLGFNGALYASFQYLVVQKIAHKLSSFNMVAWFTPVAGFAIVSMILATTKVEIYFSMVAFVLSMGFCIPGLITTISNMGSQNEQGQIMGIVGSIQALATVIVMFMGGYIHSLNINMTVIGGGLLIIVSWLAFVHLLIKNKKLNVLANKL